MKNIIKKIFFFIGRFVNILIKPTSVKNIKSCFNWVYSGYQSKQINCFSDSIYFNYPCTIIGGKYIEIGNNVSIGKRAVITAWNRLDSTPKLVIGDNTCIGDDSHITAANEIIIGSNVLMGKKITITDNSHGKGLDIENIVHPISRELYSKGPVFIGNYVWIGDKVTILSGVKIGDNSIIGANSVVTKDVPSNSIAVGNPAKIIIM